ncbi:aspartate aminotransferase family protein [Candidatus Uhrbacteria bacterium]|nr:aspartate aminotransferase family protein [Candidatus Uhrbacteria bacterium]
MSRHLAEHLHVPLDITSGNGCFLVEKSGKKLLDFIGGWCVATVGWRNKEMANAMTKQADIGVYVPPLLRYPPQEALAARLSELAPGNLSRVYRCTSGSEAVEFAVKCARAATGKPTIVSIDGVYHGHTYGAAAVGDACGKKMAPCPPGFVKLPMPKTTEEGREVAAQFEELVRTRKDVAAFLSEPVWTNVGCFIPPEGFYAQIQRICRRYGVLLAMDEVASGFGRCGTLFASELWGLKPDILCLGKAFTGGFASMGATLVTESVFKASRGIPDYSTFGWLPQDLAATAMNVEIIVRDRLSENASAVGAYLLNELEPLKKLRKIKEVRGIGLLFGIEFHLPIAALIALACYRNGLLVTVSDARTLFFSPPLVLTKKLAKQGADILKAACGSRN